MPLTAPLNSANRYAHIDALRAIAVLLVVVAHSGIGHIVPGGAGVTIFFVISGFIITSGLIREKQRTNSFAIGEFYFKRLTKLFPPFAIAVLIPSLVYAAFFPLSFKDLIAQTFFYFNWLKIDNNLSVLPGSEVVWSLAIEEQFYIAFALIWLFAYRHRSYLQIITISASAIVIYSTVLRFVIAPDVSAERIYYGTDTRLDGIAWGVLTAILLTAISHNTSKLRRVRTFLGSNWVLGLSLLLFALSLVVRDDYFRATSRYTLQSIATSLVIIYGFSPTTSVVRNCFNRICNNARVTIIGLASYSIYLVHLGLAIAVQRFTDPSLLIQVLICTALGLGFGIGVYHFIEVPILEWTRRRIKSARHSKGKKPSEPTRESASHTATS